MVIKESSDELNPTVVVPEAVTPAPRPARSFKDYLALAIATCGVGYLPLAPGTWGSLLAVGGYVFLKTAWFPHSESETSAYTIGFLIVQFAIVATITFLGIWAASRTERMFHLKDPGKVVVDEVAGQLIALMAVPLARSGPPTLMILAFFLFRFFDIVKPYPARRLEHIKGGLGVMADDLIAGVYAAVVVMIAAWVSWSV